MRYYLKDMNWKTKKVLNLILIFLLSFLINVNPVFARAGGGSSGGGSSSGGSSGGSSTHTGSSSYQTGSRGIVLDIVGGVILCSFMFSSIIKLKVKLVNSKKRSKEKLKKLGETDAIWNYKVLEKHVVNSYFVIQNAWKDNDLSKASNFMSEDLLERFQIKLDWMEFQNKKNIMDNIELISVFPVSLYDDIDDSKDYIWYYIKGRMIDYIIDTETGKKISGVTFKKSFVEYWQYKRDEDGNWVLNKILQEDENDSILS